MQAVILAAGRGTRMKELTEDTPKALLEVAGKPLLQYELEALPDEVTEIIIIVGYKGGAIQQRFGGEFNGKHILYVEQDTLDGTAGALWRAKEILKDRFVVLMSDDIYSADDITACIAKDDWVMLVSESENIQMGGSVRLDGEGTIEAIEEGSHGGKKGLINTNMFVLDTRLFQYPMLPKAPGSNEFGLPQSILPASKEAGIPFTTMKARAWIQITNPDDLKKAEEFIATQGR